MKEKPSAGICAETCTGAGLAAVRSGARSAVSVVEEHLAAAAASQDSLNAFTLIDEEGALRRAAGPPGRVWRDLNWINILSGRIYENFRILYDHIGDRENEPLQSGFLGPVGSTPAR